MEMIYTILWYISLYSALVVWSPSATQSEGVYMFIISYKIHLHLSDCQPAFYVVSRVLLRRCGVLTPRLICSVSAIPTLPQFIAAHRLSALFPPIFQFTLRIADWLGLLLNEHDSCNSRDESPTIAKSHADTYMWGGIEPSTVMQRT
jgi:hypothetical protein